MPSLELPVSDSADLPQVLSATAAIAVRRTLLFLVATSLIFLIHSELSGDPSRQWQTIIVGVLLPLWSYFEMRHKHINRAFVTFSWGLFLYAFGTSFYVGGIQAPALIALPLSIMLCAWVQGRRFAVAMTILSLSALCVLVIGQHNGWWLPLILRQPSQILIVYSGVIAMVGVTAVLIAEHLKEISAQERAVSIDLKGQVAALARTEAALTARGSELELALFRLQETHEQLAHSEAKATLSTLIASVSHELGTPVGNGVMMASTLADQSRDFERVLDSGNLKRSDLASFVASQREGSSMILANLKRATELLTNFRQVAADQASEQRREFDLKTVVLEVLSTLTPTIKRHSHRVEIDIPDGILMDSQPGPLGQIVINLINNAYIHAFEGRTEGVLAISAQLQDQDVTMRFRDNGVGIEQNNLEKLFEPFFSTKIGRGGTGSLVQ
jgi:signal transduction histidine kinase